MISAVNLVKHFGNGSGAKEGEVVVDYNAVVAKKADKCPDYDDDTMPISISSCSSSKSSVDGSIKSLISSVSSFEKGDDDKKPDQIVIDLSDAIDLEDSASALADCCDSSNHISTNIETSVTENDSGLDDRSKELYSILYWEYNLPKHVGVSMNQESLMQWAKMMMSMYAEPMESIIDRIKNVLMDNFCDENDAVQISHLVGDCLLEDKQQEERRNITSQSIKRSFVCTQFDDDNEDTKVFNINCPPKKRTKSQVPTKKKLCGILKKTTYI